MNQILVSVSNADSGAPFNPEHEIARVENDESGAVVSFIGRVRRSEYIGSTTESSGQNIKTLTAMRIEHYPGMTEQLISEICEQACQRWLLQHCIVTHRVGTLAVGQPIVMVLTAAMHRSDAFEACEFIMDYLKTDATFWKKAIYQSGEHWVEARDSDERRRDRWQAG